jgi:ribose/xylose/arabinose/galactoside ABC-type transport system permease subunit
MTVMLVGGLFDLSVGAMASLAGVVVGYCMKSLGWPIPAAIAGGVAIAALGGLVNGLIVAKVRVNALITTLGTMAIFKGAAERIGGPGISNLPEGFSQFGRAEPRGGFASTITSAATRGRPSCRASPSSGCRCSRSPSWV